MKKLIYILFVAFSISTVAQEKLTEGVITSIMTLSSTSPEVQSQFDMIGEIGSTTYFKENKTRTETNSMMTGESINVIDSDAQTQLVIMNNPMAGGKVYAEKSIVPSKEDLDNMTIKKGDETKTILGYECIEYNIVVKTGESEVKMDVYSTDNIQAVNQQTTSFGKDYKGYPMYMEIHMNQMGMDMTMTMEVTKVNAETVADDKFDMTPPEGYKKVDQLKQGM